MMWFWRGHTFEWWGNALQWFYWIWIPYNNKKY